MLVHVQGSTRGRQTSGPFPMKPPDPKDYYRILEIEPNAGPRSVRAAYRRLSKLYHPDSASDLQSTHRMQEINEAYEILSNPFRRLRYDYARYGRPPPPPGFRLKLLAQPPPLAPQTERVRARNIRAEVHPLVNFIGALLESRWFAIGVLAALFAILFSLPQETRNAIIFAFISIVNPGAIH